MAVTPCGAAASGAGALLAAVNGGAVLNNNSLSTPISELYDRYQLLGFQGTPDDYLSSLASAISLTDDSACFPRSTDLNADLTPAQQSMVWENAAEKAKKARALHVTQQAKMQRQSRAPLTDEEPSQVMYCTSVGYFY